MNNTKQGIFINHLGFLCRSVKTFVAEQGPVRKFMIQDMSKVAKENLGEYENWQTVFTGKLEEFNGAMGNYLLGDFSEMTRPGIYRIVLPDESGHSYQFSISDGIFHPLVRFFVDFVHNWRSGDYSNPWRTKGHLDDAIRSDNGKYWDVSGGWYDAGDTRKWMTMSVLPVLAFLDLHEKPGFNRNHIAGEKISDDDMITEAVWGIRFILKMQDPETGMIYEEVGAGGDARKKPGMTWWYDNHSGCLADNSQNHFTDNILNSGDERLIRVNYNPIVQYTNLTILLKSGLTLKTSHPGLAGECFKAAKRIWDFTKTRQANDPLHHWTSVRAWRLSGGILLKSLDWISEGELEHLADELLANFDPYLGFWHMDDQLADPYRGVLHSAQPVIALLQLLNILPESNNKDKVIQLLLTTWEKYIYPMTKTNPFGIMPYGCYLEKKTEIDRYRPFRDRYLFRFFMPDHSLQRINHGLGGHWTSWAHALALMGQYFNNGDMLKASWDQLFWLWGANPLNSCMVSGIGYNNPMPHSRFLGTYPGGFCVGPRGNAEDKIEIDLNARAEWSSTEYWLTPLSNALMALTILLPDRIPESNKIGGAKP